MTDPIARFEAEHQVALAALARLEQAARGLEAGGSTDAPFGVAREVHGVLVGAVREHNEAEERALFPLIRDEAPLGPFLEEHQTLWQLEADLAAAIDRRDAGRTARCAREIVELLRVHIQRENEMLFPLARTLLGPAGLHAVALRLETS